MGGGGGSSRTLGNITELEKKAKEELQRAKGERRNVFISFAYEDIDEINLLRGQAKNERSDLEFSDWSVREPFDSERAEYIRQGITERIRHSSQTVVYISPSSANSKWVNWEIRKSLELGKNVIAFHKGGQVPRALPEAVKENKIKIVAWKHLSKEL